VRGGLRPILDRSPLSLHTSASFLHVSPQSRDPKILPKAGVDIYIHRPTPRRRRHNRSVQERHTESILFLQKELDSWFDHFKVCEVGDEGIEGTFEARQEEVRVCAAAL